MRSADPMSANVSTVTVSSTGAIVGVSFEAMLGWFKIFPAQGRRYR